MQRLRHGSQGARWATAATLLVIAGLVAAASLWMIRNAPTGPRTQQSGARRRADRLPLQFASCYAIPRDARGEIMTG